MSWLISSGKLTVLTLSLFGLSYPWIPWLLGWLAPGTSSADPLVESELWVLAVSGRPVRARFPPDVGKSPLAEGGGGLRLFCDSKLLVCLGCGLSPRWISVVRQGDSLTYGWGQALEYMVT